MAGKIKSTRQATRLNRRRFARQFASAATLAMAGLGIAAGSSETTQARAGVIGRRSRPASKTATKPAATTKPIPSAPLANRTPAARRDRPPELAFFDDDTLTAIVKPVVLAAARDAELRRELRQQMERVCGRNVLRELAYRSIIDQRPDLLRRPMILRAIRRTVFS